MDSINTERSYTEYEVTEPTTDFAIGFDNYSGEDKDAIHVTLDGVNLDNLDYTVVRKNAQVIEVTPAIESGVVRLQRETYIDQAFHNFTAGALFSPKAMDENFAQIRHSQQEVNDGFTFLADNTLGVVAAADAATARANAAAEYAEGLDVVTLGVTVEGHTFELNALTVSMGLQGIDTGITTSAKLGGVTRTQAAKNSDTVSIKDFGAVGDGVTDDSVAFNKLIAYANSVPSVAVYLPAGRYLISQELSTINVPVTWYANNRHTTSLLFSGVRGFDYDISGDAPYFVASNFTNITFITNGVTAYKAIYFKGRQTFSARDSCLTFSNCSFIPLAAIDSSLSNTQEWHTAVHLYDTDEVVFDNCFFQGAGTNATYENRTTGKLLFIDTATGIRVKDCSFFFGASAIEVTGQSEGSIISGLTVVATTRGVVFEGLTNPSNNHIVHSSHFSCYHRGIDFVVPTGTNPKTQGNFISGCFLLERQGTKAKADGYIAINAAFKQSVISNCHISSGTATALNNIGINLWKDGNSVSNIIFKSSASPISLIAGDSVNGTTIINSCQNTTAGTLLIGDTSRVIHTGVEQKAMQYEIGANELLFHNATNSVYFAITGSKLQLGDGSSGAKYIDFKTASGTSNYDVRLLSIGGNPSTDARANFKVYAVSTDFVCPISPETDNTYDMGTSAKRWKTIYAATSTISTSDERLKTEFIDVSAAEKSAALKIKASIGRYQFTDAVAEKGDKARYHFGVGAQTVGDIMRDEGLDPEQYAFYCYDEWEATDEVLDDDGSVISEASPAGNRYGIRYEELIMFLLTTI